MPAVGSHSDLQKLLTSVEKTEYYDEEVTEKYGTEEKIESDENEETYETYGPEENYDSKENQESDESYENEEITEKHETSGNSDLHEIQEESGELQETNGNTRFRKNGRRNATRQINNN